MKSTITKSTGNTVELTLLLPWESIKTNYDQIIEQLISQIELPGFRKGKAPKDLALKQINRSQVYEETIKKVLPSAYSEAISEHKLQPIITPKIELLEAETGKEWKVKVTTCEKPEIQLGNYAEAVAKLKESKSKKIWVPGTEKTPDKKENEAPTVGEVLDALETEIKGEISPILIEEEVNRMLSNLVTEIQKLGLSVDEYLKAQGKTVESLRKEYSAQAEKSIRLEFGLEEIADKEKISVDEAEITAFIQNAKTEAEKQMMTERKYYIATILRRQKTLSKLLESKVLKV